MNDQNQTPEDPTPDSKLENVFQASPSPKVVDVEKITKMLPAMVGGIDQAFLDAAGAKIGFILVAVANGRAMFATNGNPAMAGQCIKELAKVWDEADGVDNPIV